MALLASLTVIAALLVPGLSPKGSTPALAAADTPSGVTNGLVATIASGLPAASPSAPAQGANWGGGGVAVIGAYAYTATNNTITRVTLSGGATQVLAGSSTRGCSDGSSGAGSSFVTDDYSADLAVQGADLILAEGCGLRRINTTTGATSTIAVGQVYGVTVGPDSAIYYAAGNQIFKLPSGSTTPAVYAASSQYNGRFTGLAVDSTGLFAIENYYDSNSHSFVHLTKVDSGGNVSVLSADPALGIGALLLAGPFLYTGVADQGQSSATRQTILRRYDKVTGAVANVAGATSGLHDGVGARALFARISDVAQSGPDLIVIDTGGNNALRRVTDTTALPDAQPASVTTATAITAGAVISSASVPAALPASPSPGAYYGGSAVAVLGTTAYVASGNEITAVVKATGATSLLAGSATAGCADAPLGSSATFSTDSSRSDMTTDGTFLYLADNCGLRRIDPLNGATSRVFAGQALGVTVDATGWLIISSGAQLLRVNPASNEVQTLASSGLKYGQFGGVAADSTGIYVIENYEDYYGNPLARIDRLPTGGALSTLVQDNSLGYGGLELAGGYLYTAVSDPSHTFTNYQTQHIVRRYSKSDGQSRDIAGSYKGFGDGTGAKAQFSRVNDLASDGTTLWVADAGDTNKLRKITNGAALPSSQPTTASSAVPVLYGAVSTVTGLPAVSPAAPPTGALPGGGAVTILSGYAYTATGNLVTKVNLTSGSTALLAGDTANTACTDGIAATAGFRTDNNIVSMTNDGTFLYLADGCGLRRIDPATGKVSTMYQGGPYAVAYGGDGYLYLASQSNGIIKLNLSNNSFVTVATSSLHDGLFTGIAADNGHVYASEIWDTYGSGANHARIVRVEPDGSLTQLVQDDFIGRYSPALVSVGSYLYYAEHPDSTVPNSLNARIVAIAKADGTSSFVAGSGTGAADGIGPAAAFARITGIASNGRSLYVVDTDGNNLLRKVVPAPPPPVPAAQTWGYNGLLSSDGGSGGASNAGACKCPTGADTSMFTGAGGDPVSTLTGAMSYATTDLSLPSVGEPIVWTRAYTSADTTVGPLGQGWTVPFNASLTDGAGGTKVFRAEDGMQVVFAPNGAGWLSPPGVHSVLASDGSSGFTVTTRDHLVDSFNGLGQLTFRKDRYGNGVALTYSYGVLTSITDNSGQVATLTWNAGRITRVALPDGRHVDYGYTGGLLTSATDMDGKTSTLAYGTDSRLVSVTDPNGHEQFHNTYNATSGRVTSQLDGKGKQTTFGWNATTQTATTTDPRGGVTTDVYANNVLISRTTPAGTTTWTYDQSGNVIGITDGLGNTTTNRYDAAGNLISLDGPAGTSKRYTYDANNLLLTVTDGRGLTTTSHYDAQGRLDSSTDAFGLASGVTYGTDTEITSTTDRRAATTTHTYDALGNRLSSTSPMGEKVTRTFDASGRLSTITDPRGNIAGCGCAAAFTTSTTYDNDDRIKTTTDALGRTTSNTYDPAGNLITVTDATGLTLTHTYDANNRLLTTTSHPTSTMSRTTSYAYDDAGNLISQTNPDGGITTFGYDLAGRRTSMVAPLGNVSGAPAATKTAYTTTYTYDALGNVLTMSRPNPAGGAAILQTYTYDAVGRQVTSKNALSQVTTTTYDAAGNTATVTDPLGHTVTTTYDADNRPATTTDARGKVTTYGYDAEGNMTSTTSPLGEKTTKTYDNDGRVKTSVEPRGNVLGCGCAADYTTTYAYDGVNNVVTVTDPLGHVTTSSYDAANQVTQVADANNHTTQYGYDQLGRVTAVQAADTTDPTKKTTYAYDDTDGLLSSTDPLGHTTSYSYDANGRQVTKISPTGQTWTRSFDVNSNVTASVAARGNTTGNTPAQIAAGTTTYAYDTLDQLTGLTFGDGTPAIAYSYNTAGQRTKMIDGVGQQDRTYDAAGNLLTVKTTPTSGTAQTYTYTYDADNNLASRKYPDAVAQTLGYDDDGRLSSFAADGATTAYAYDAAGDLTTSTLPSTTHETTTRTYDKAGRLTSVGNQVNATTLSKTDWTLDAVGNPSTAVVTRGSTAKTNAYTYDPANRLTGVCYGTNNCSSGGTGQISWAYDLVGNRTTETRTGDTQPAGATGPVTTSYAYDAADELTTATASGGLTSTTGYTYDADGNQLTAGSATSTYNLRNQLASIASGGSTTSYAYTGDGDRRTATTGSSSTTFSWDVNQAVPQLGVENAGTTTRAYRYGAQSLPASYTATGTSGPTYYLTDQANNVTDTLSKTGVAQWANTYEPFGTVRSSVNSSGTAPVNPLGFASAYTDPSGQLDMRARQYDPATGRFTATDPVAAPAGTAAFGTYNYASDNPNTQWDPNGEFSRPHMPKVLKDAGHAIGKVSDAVTATAEGAFDAVNETVTGVATMVAHPMQTYHAMVAGCNAGFDKWGGGISLEGALQCIDNLNPAAQIRNGLQTAYQLYRAGCTHAAIRALTKNVINGALYLSPASELSAARAATTATSAAREAATVAKSGSKAAEDTGDLASAARTCSVNSFTGATLVTMADGSKKPIRDVKVGDKVLATDPETGETAARPVTKLIVHSGKHIMVDVHLADGSTITATDRHPFWDATTGEFTYAMDLRTGEKVREIDGTLLAIAGTRVYDEDVTAYNLTVDGIHTYYAGTTPVLVHNSCGEIPWSHSSVGRAAGELDRGASSATVASRSEAEEIFLGQYQGQGFTNTTGMSGREVREFFGGKAGTYHWDTDMTPGLPHSFAPHLQIHGYDGTIQRIFFGVAE